MIDIKLRSRTTRYDIKYGEITCVERIVHEGYDISWRLFVFGSGWYYLNYLDSDFSDKWLETHKEIFNIEKIYQSHIRKQKLKRICSK